MPSHRSFLGGPQGHQTTLKETWLLRVLLGHQATKKKNKISSNCKFAVGLPKKIFLQSFMKDLVCRDVRFTRICVFLPLEKHSFCFSFFLNFYWPLSLLHLATHGMLSMSWGSHHLILFPSICWRIEALPQDFTTSSMNFLLDSMKESKYWEYLKDF